jgi:hypothetical protein
MNDLAVGFPVLFKEMRNDLTACCSVCYSKSTRSLVGGVSDAGSKEVTSTSKMRSDGMRRLFIRHR